MFLLGGLSFSRCVSTILQLVVAERRLQVERKLAKDEKIATAYQQVIDEYLQKNYIRHVLPTEEKSEVEWLLPHFPVIRSDRATTKVRIMFDT